MQRTASALVVVALALTACAGDQPDVGLERLRPAAATAGPPTGDSTPVTEADAPPSAATTAGIGVTTAPDEVTPEWVTAVVNALLAEYGEMTAEILAMPVQDDPTLPDGFEERLDALFDGQYLNFAAAELQLLLTEPSEREGLLPASEFSGLRFAAVAVQETSDHCIVVVGRIDRTGTTYRGDVSGSLSAAALSHGGSAPTAWLLRDLLANNDVEGRPNSDETMLKAELDDYGAALDHTCGGHA